MKLLKLDGDYVLPIEENEIASLGQQICLSESVVFNFSSCSANYSIPIIVNGTQFKLLLYKYPSSGIPNHGYYFSGRYWDSSSLVWRYLVTTYKFDSTNWVTMADVIEHKNNGGAFNSFNRIYFIFGNHDGIERQNNFEYLPNTWSTKSSRWPERQYVTATNIDSYGYSWGGLTNNSFFPDHLLDKNDKYSGEMDSWTAQTNTPNPIYNASSFTINTKGYLVCGTIESGNIKTTSEYNPSVDGWISRSDAPDTDTENLGVNDTSYGFIYQPNFALWQYTAPPTDSWTSKANCKDLVGRTWVTYEDELFICGGQPSGGQTDSVADTDKYNQGSDSWSASVDMLKAQSYGQGSRLYIP